ncbi:Hypothetical predicted protein [Mytilus galloprovincialis]|uniref:Uncharacterized protein n=1 Tax=Mytilus galloprovincialis TaxID=29158 RepID=A0A8B6BPK5_MYTGA|nr:Hypothetical predicted protein [Mytilus galloprovincialis]
MYNNGKTPSNYNQHQQIQAKLDSAIDNLDIFDKTDNVVSFRTDNPPSYPVEDCDNNTTIPYDDQPFLQPPPPTTQLQTQHFSSLYPSLKTSTPSAVTSATSTAHLPFHRQSQHHYQQLQTLDQDQP